MDLKTQLNDERIRQMYDRGYWQSSTLLDSLDEAVKSTPKKTAFVSYRTGQQESERLSYEELDRAVTRAAVALSRAGAEQGETVSFQLPNWWQFIVLHLACLRIGAITHPLMPIFRERELRFMLSHAESRVMVVPKVFRDFDFETMLEKFAPELKNLRKLIVINDEAELFDVSSPLSADEEAEALRLFAERRPASDDVIQVMYTSGTTGEPKGVMHTSNTLLSHLRPSVQRLGLSAADIVFCPTPLAHQLGFLYGLMLPLTLGATGVLLDVWNAEAAAGIIQREKATFAMGSTPFLADLANLPELHTFDVSSLRLFFSAGAPIPRSLVRNATERLGARIVSAWGMTENGAPTIVRPSDPEEKVFTTDGVDLEGMEVRVVDESDQAVGTGNEGRLQVRGASNFVGYLKRPELYGMDHDGWFDTGDLARMDADGYIRISGRAKDVIIRGGENIPVVEVEDVLYRHPAIASVAIVAMPDERLGERACAFVELKQGMSLSFQEMVEHLAEHGMTRSYFPEKLEVLSELPRTPSGKLQKFKLRERAYSASDGMVK